MTEIQIYQVDAFTNRPFTGNPAAVCPLDAWLPDETLLAIAAENNLSETAFFVRKGDHFDLRWFTPTIEVELCGHATLASGSVILNRIEPSWDKVSFQTRSGELVVKRAKGGAWSLDLPARPPLPTIVTTDLVEALGARPTYALQSRDIVAVYDNADIVRHIKPDMARITALPTFAVAITAPGSHADADVDFVSRFFAPAKGVPEDPVTGSLHCTLVPYWAAKLGRKHLRARQVSARGGEIECTLENNRVELVGDAVMVLEGRLRF
jgi:PhzF family phenazine biosynthesis protein